jgi:hypothetical protein
MVLSGSGNTPPGVVYVGDVKPNFGPVGKASQPNWLVGGAQYPTTFSPVNPTVGRSSYSYLLTSARQSGIDLTQPQYNLATYCPGLTCSLNNLPHGIYVAYDTNTGLTGNPVTLTLNASTFQALQGYVILVNGDLYIQGNIQVLPGSDVTFSVSNNITIDPSVGESDYNSTAPDLQGFFSADNSFIMPHKPGPICNPDGSNIDKRLNVQGGIIVNAALKSPPGQFINNRDLCKGDLTCPVFFESFRTDFILNAPRFIKHQNSFWQEEAP